MAENLTKSWIWGHLTELRRRLFYALLGLIVAVLASFFCTEHLIAYLTIPVGGLGNLQAVEVTENVAVYMRIALLSGFIIALPWILYQLLIFVIPGLTSKERKWITIGIPLAGILFIAGVAFAYFIMLAPAIQIMTEFLGVEVRLRVKSYIDFITNLLFWMGVIFQFPLLIFLLARLGVINSRQLLKGWRIAVVLIAILAAAITPTIDPVNMALFMLPLLILYILSILLAALAGKNRLQKAEGE